MGVRMRGVCVLAVSILVVISPVFAQRSPDGLPRPVGYPQTPTTAYGALPPCVDSTTNTAVDCEWYGFAHINYPAIGAQCLVKTRAYMSNTSLVGLILPYEYYYLRSQIFDPSTNTSYCLYGCFKIASTPATPPAAFAPPPVEDPATPAPALFAPPPVEDPATPPPAAFAPPPVEDPATPPPVVGTPPPLLASPPPVEDPAIPPPALLAPPTIPPPTDSTTPPGAAVPPTGPPPPAPSGFFSLNAAGFVRPVTSVLSLVVSGALLVLNLLVS